MTQPRVRCDDQRVPQSASLTVIRRPLALRVFIALFALVACGDVLIGLVIAVVNRSPAALVILLMLASFTALLYSSYRVSAEIRDGELLVRNRFRKHAIRREDIAGFHIGPTGWDPFRESIHVSTNGGQVVELAVTRRADSLRRGRNQLVQHLDDLTAWKAQPLESRQLKDR